MANFADAPLLKVTLNLYAKDVKWFKNRFGQGYTKDLRDTIHDIVKEAKRHERTQRTDG